MSKIPGTTKLLSALARGPMIYRGSNGSKVILAIEDGRWHLSISFPDRDPTWEEIREARYHFIPDEAHVAMILPPKAEYVNAHPHCFHLWEIKERW